MVTAYRLKNYFIVEGKTYFFFISSFSFKTTNIKYTHWLWCILPKFGFFNTVNDKQFSPPKNFKMSISTDRIAYSSLKNTSKLCSYRILGIKFKVTSFEICEKLYQKSKTVKKKKKI